MGCWRCRCRMPRCPGGARTPIRRGPRRYAPRRAATMMKLYAGTSGFSYKGWTGSFYPEGLPAGGMLRYYAGRLPAVEVNNTFYRAPMEGLLAEWAEKGPARFPLALKGSPWLPLQHHLG